MSLFWLVFDTPKGAVVRIQQAYSAPDARLKASLAGACEGFKELHELDAKTSEKIPTELIDTNLSGRVAKNLVQKLA
jgi:hypothetical protein